MVWSTIDYGKSINEIIEKKVIAEILCICCIALSIAMAFLWDIFKEHSFPSENTGPQLSA